MVKVVDYEGPESGVVSRMCGVNSKLEERELILVVSPPADCAWHVLYSMKPNYEDVRRTAHLKTQICSIAYEESGVARSLNAEFALIFASELIGIHENGHLFNRVVLHETIKAKRSLRPSLNNADIQNKKIKRLGDLALRGKVTGDAETVASFHNTLQFNDFTANSVHSHFLQVK